MTGIKVLKDIGLTGKEFDGLKESRMDWTDAEAARRAGKGDLDAFRGLVDRHSRVIYRLAYSIAGNQTDAEDLVQETFLKAFKQVHRFDGRASFSTWLYRICANCSFDLVRARKARKAENVESSDKGSRMRRESLVAQDPSPERLVLSSEFHELLEPALQQLSEKERTAFVLRHFEGCDIPEIARTLGIRGNAAKHTVFRAVQKVRRALEPVFGGLR